MEDSFRDPPASPTAACTQELNSQEGHGAANNHDMRISRRPHLRHRQGIHGLEIRRALGGAGAGFFGSNGSA